MSPWLCMVIIFLAGGFGGIANALINKEGLLFPHWKNGVWIPGFIGNAFTGAMAALISWGLYSSGSSIELAPGAADNPEVSLTVGSVTAAILVGVGGTRWLSNEVDKKLLRQAASEAGSRDIPPDDCNKIRKASPMRALQLAQSFPTSHVIQ
ncbi:hypothetical protein HRE53_30305 (plasmid) [Acaryochloris sp. 'Moss Beach']|uniref:hypothetical protein n=1 Tax=Acaryochloris sp. 'Moss Beach' TaxID=2740837 RepID=UPI001F3992E6|nr:hypothetical protein [Acaryochloris sp. 'Moss Beach']UJB73024.1 hypothetical protein HRE53_30305 [Acaryochloris sp. 'Moss Beach']